MHEQIYPVKRGQDYELEITKLAFGGAGVARIDNYVIFVRGAIPGDRVFVRLLRRKSSFAEAKLLSIITPSPKRIPAPCPYFGWCGGCNWQNLQYKDQLEYKEQFVRDALMRVGGLEEINIQSMIASNREFAYRNKMEFSFSDRRWLLPHEFRNDKISNDFALGLHIQGTFDKILQIDHCLLQSEVANHILLFIKNYVLEHKLEPYGIKSHQGFLRFLVIRESNYDRSIMINLVTAYDNRRLLQGLADNLVKRYPVIKSIVNNINSRLAQIAAGEKEYLLAGESLIQEKLADLIFNISANSFFQTNTLQAERLYNKVLEYSELSGHEIVWDLYSGTGTIAMFLARKAKEVIGFEMSESSVLDAQKNAQDHQLNNLRFICGDLLHQLKEVNPKPEVLITDPPRSGMHPKVVEMIVHLAPKKIIYVSCNPTTLARDLALMKSSYKIELVQPLDMFPQTYHIEMVVKLSLKRETTI